MLLLVELSQRRYEVEGETAGDSPSDLTLGALYRVAPGVAGLYALHDDRWKAWKDGHRSEYAQVRDLVGRLMADRRVMLLGKGRAQARIVLGERRRVLERYEALRDELGCNFIANRIDRAAQVRQWDKRRRDREARSRT